MGQDLTNYKVFFYQAGTSTKQDAYTSSDESVALSNPLSFNSYGEGNVWLGNNKKYKIVVAIPACQDPPQLGEIILSQDNITGFNQFNTSSVSTNTTVTSADVNKIFVVDTTSGAVTIIPPALASVSDGFFFYVKKIDASSNAVTVDPPGAVLIDHAATYSIVTQDESVMVFKYGSQWGTLNVRMTSELRDTNHNVVLNSSALVSPVNYLQAIHSVTGDPVGFNALGTDTNIPFRIQPKGNSALVVLNQDSRTASTNFPLSVSSTTSGTPAAGIGTGILVQAQSADENPSSFGALTFSASDITAASEDTYFSVLTRRAGAALAEAFRWTSVTAFKLIHTFSGTADRTVSWPDCNVNKMLVNYLSLTSSNTSSTPNNIPFDSTIPQITEGAQLWSQSYTAQAGNIVEIEVVSQFGVGALSTLCQSIFVDSTANAVACTGVTMNAVVHIAPLTTKYVFTAPDSSAHTYSVRYGCNSGTAYFGGGSGNTYGTNQHGWFIIREYSV